MQTGVNGPLKIIHLDTNYDLCCARTFEKKKEMIDVRRNYDLFYDRYNLLFASLKIEKIVLNEQIQNVEMIRKFINKI